VVELPTALLVTKENNLNSINYRISKHTLRLINLLKYA